MVEIRLTGWYGEYPIIYRALYIPAGWRVILPRGGEMLPSNYRPHLPLEGEPGSLVWEDSESWKSPKLELLRSGTWTKMSVAALENFVFFSVFFFWVGPKINDVPPNRNHLKKTFHLPTNKFQQHILVFGGVDSCAILKKPPKTHIFHQLSRGFSIASSCDLGYFSMMTIFCGKKMEHFFRDLFPKFFTKNSPPKLN